MMTLFPLERVAGAILRSELEREDMIAFAKKKKGENEIRTLGRF